jgi:hypothetical protein
MNFKQTTLLCLVGATLIAGCGTGNSPIEADKDNVNRAKVMRDLYTKSSGNYDSLTPSEKEQFQKVIAPGMPVDKAWAALAPQRAGAAGDPRQGG